MDANATVGLNELKDRHSRLNARIEALRRRL